MTEDKFSKALQEMAEHHNDPPGTPREEMWERIEAARAESGRGQRSNVVRWSGWGVGIAAALAIGVGLGRYTGTEGVTQPDSVATVAMGAVNETNELYHFAATQHLAQVEVFLTMFRVDAASGRAIDEVSVPATDLLSTTRLYLDSPASENPQLRTLLEDIELVLAQITQLTRPDRGELTLIDESIEQNGVLLRLQSAVGAGAGPGTQGAL